MSKKIFLQTLVSSFILLSSCATPNSNLILDENYNQTQTKSLFGNKKGDVPDNGDPNIRMDNLLLSRRTFNNATPKIYIDGSTAYPAMETLINNAKKNLFIETFIFHDDMTGRRIADKIVSKVRQGIDVRILIDELGLLTQKGSRIFDYLISKGVNVRKYNKNLIGLNGVNITHRKLLIADGEIAITGGMNFGDEYEKEWHDSMTEVQGECVQDIQKEFFVDWSKTGGNKPEVIPTLELGKIYGTTPIRVAVTSAFEKKKKYQIKDSLLTAIDYAKDKIIIEGAYFSDDDLIKKIVEAKKRGVNVEVIMPKKTNNALYTPLNLATAKFFLKNDIKVYFYKPRFSHIKASLVDNFVILGSANQDERSFRVNQELNVIVEDSAFKQDVENRLFEVDKASSEISTLESVKVGPLKKLAQTALEIIDYYL